MTEEKAERAAEGTGVENIDGARSDRLKKGIVLGTLAVSAYTLDRLLGEEKIIYLSDKKQIRVRKGFFEEFLEDQPEQGE